MLRNGSDLPVLISGGLAFVLVVVLSCSRSDEPPSGAAASDAPEAAPPALELVRRDAAGGSAVFSWRLLPAAADHHQALRPHLGDPQERAAAFFAAFAADAGAHWYQQVRVDLVGERGGLRCFALREESWCGGATERGTRYLLLDAADGSVVSWRDRLVPAGQARLIAHLRQRLDDAGAIHLAPQAVGFDAHGLLLHLGEPGRERRLSLPWAGIADLVAPSADERVARLD